MYVEERDYGHAKKKRGGGKTGERRAESGKNLLKAEPHPKPYTPFNYHICQSTFYLISREEQNLLLRSPSHTHKKKKSLREKQQLQKNLKQD